MVLCCKKDPPAPLPVANFIVQNNNCTALCSLYFYDQSKNAVKWKWDFGNGTISTSADDTVKYVTAGDFEVWLYIWNIDQVKDSIRKTVSIN